MDDAVVLAARGELHSVSAHVGNFAVLDAHPLRAAGEHRASEKIGRLAVKRLPLVGKRPVGVKERQAAEHHVVNQAIFFPVALELHQRRQRGRDAHGAGHVFTRQRIILQPPGLAVEVPLARGSRASRTLST